MGHTDRQTLCRYIEPALHTVQAVPIIHTLQNSESENVTFTSYCQFGNTWHIATSHLTKQLPVESFATPHMRYSRCKYCRVKQQLRGGQKFMCRLTAADMNRARDCNTQWQTDINRKLKTVEAFVHFSATTHILLFTSIC